MSTGESDAPLDPPSGVAPASSAVMHRSMSVPWPAVPGTAAASTPATAAPPTLLEEMLLAVEFRLAALGEALRLLDTRAIDSHASELHRALAVAVASFSDAAREGPVALDLRQRLAAASGRVAAQRNALAQATAALDRAIDTLLPERARVGESGGTAAQVQHG